MKKLLRKTIRWMANTPALSLPRGYIKKAVTYAVESKNGVILFYDDAERGKVVNLTGKIKQETEMLLGNNEAYQIFMAVNSVKKVKGDLAEVGVYRGGSAKIICEAKGDKALYLFDTFEGLPDVDKSDSSHFHKGQFFALFDHVKDYLKDYKNVYFYKGLFPDTAEPIRNKTFSFVNLDVDIYKSTLECLKFFYPRMNAGGVIISHDYITSAGVRKAFDEFFEDKPDPIIELSGTQCLVVKTSR